MMASANGSRSAGGYRHTVLYLPHFISWVVVAGIARATLFTTNGGTVNMLIESLGGSGKPFLSDTGWWTVMYVLMNTWMSHGDRFRGSSIFLCIGYKFK